LPIKGPGNGIDQQDLLRRIEQLEKRPTIFQLDPDFSYVIIVPGSTTQEDYDSLCSAVSRYNNVHVISADNVKFLEIT